MKSRFLKREKDELLRISEVSLWLDTYDDIFSDFDPRPYTERSISDDFLFETRKAVREKKSGAFELRLLIPSLARKFSMDRMVSARLVQYFENHYDKVARDAKFFMLKGFVFTCVGALLMLLASFLPGFASDSNFLPNMLFMWAEPSSWFFFWEGLNMLFIGSKDKRQDLVFFRKMMNCELKFVSY